LELNEIGAVLLETRQPLFFDAYRRNRASGSFILIDPLTNATVGAGMILERARDRATTDAALLEVDYDTTRVSAAERQTRSGHQPATIWLTARKELAWMLERRLFERGCQVHALSDDVESHLLPELARILNAAGLIVICSEASDEPGERERALSLVGAARFVDIAPGDLSPRDDEAVGQICRMLEQRGLIGPHGFGGGEGI